MVKKSLKMNLLSITDDIASFVDTMPIDRVAASEGRVLIKPNLVLLDEYPYTTSPDVLRALITLLLQKGIRNITIADGPCTDRGVVFNRVFINEEQMKNEMLDFHVNIRASESDIGSEMYYQRHSSRIEEYFNHFFSCHKLNEVLSLGLRLQNLFSSNENLVLKKIHLSDKLIVSYLDLSPYDSIINLPVLKLHTTTGFTAAIKNFYGLLTPFDKLIIHKYKAIGKLLIKLYEELSTLDIYTFLDGRLIPDAQQSV